MNESEAIFLLGRHFCWGSTQCFPNVHLCGGEMDLAVVSRAGYLWEVEVKLTLADWRADERKGKWLSPSRKYVSRFFYAVPSELVGAAPSFVPPETGLLEIGPSWVKEIRTAKRRKVSKLTDAQMSRLLDSTYHRYWQERIHRHYYHRRVEVRAA